MLLKAGTTLFFWFVLSLSAYAQSQLLAVAEDSSVTIELRINEMLEQPFITDIDSSLQRLNLISAYFAWTTQTKIHWSTPLEELINIYSDRARARMLLGIHKGIAIMKYAPMESGVLPLIDIAVAEFDSASADLEQIEPYIVSERQEAIRMDRKFSAMVSDSLKAIRKKIRETHSFWPAISFNAWDTFKHVGLNVSQDSAKIPEVTITHWVLSGVKEYEPKPRSLLRLQPELKTQK